jgi:hypothetical protein
MLGQVERIVRGFSKRSFSTPNGCGVSRSILALSPEVDGDFPKDLFQSVMAVEHQGVFYKIPDC